MEEWRRAATERGGIANAVAGVATARNRVVASAIDGSAGFVEQSAVATSYGTFTIGSSGRWTYRLNDGNADVQGLNVGDTLHDVITITTSGGTSTSNRWCATSSSSRSTW